MYHVDELTAITFDYGQKHKKEIDFAAKTCKKLGINHLVIPLDVLNNIAPSALTRTEIKVPKGPYTEDTMKQTVVPNRNMVMLSLATSYAFSIGAKRLFYGAHFNDREVYPDCKREFVESLEKTIKLADWFELLLSAPYIDKDKTEIIELGTKYDVDYSLTWSCYEGREKACGKCGSCIERLDAFRRAGLKDPIEYDE